MTRDRFDDGRRTVFGLERWAFAAGGIALIALAARDRTGTASRLLMALAGAALAVRGFGGHRSVRTALERRDRLRNVDRPTGPLPTEQASAPLADRERRNPGDIFEDSEDKVDEASQESFPASDPPGYTPLRAAADSAFEQR